MWFLRAGLRLCFAFQVEGEEYVRRQQAVILAGNHTGWLDGALLMAAVNRPIRFLVAEKVFRWPIVGWLVRCVGVIPVSPQQGTAALANAVASLRRGHAVGIFPEGRLTRDGRIGPFHKGVARLHQESQVPIVPFVIQGGFETWPWGRWWPRPRKIILQFGQPMMRIAEDKQAVVEELRQRIQFMKEALERREQGKADQAYQESVLSLMEMKSDVYGAHTALLMKEDGHWKELSYMELSRRARDFSDALIESGLPSGERIAILSESRPEWGVAFFAAIRSGAIIVPLDVKLTMAELTSMLSDAAPAVLCVSAQLLEIGQILRRAVPSIQRLILLNEGTGTAQIPSIDQLRASQILEGRDRTLDETALIIYTSGTTGSPKGVMVSFRNLIFQIKCFEQIMHITRHDLFLSMLPLNHLLELTGGFLGVLHAGGRICYAQTLYPQELSGIMREQRVTLMITVPLFLKMLQGHIAKEIQRAGRMRQQCFRLAFGIARWIPVRGVRRVLFAPIHRQFGGRLRGFVAGGAPLDLEVETFFHRIGLPIYQGYGLTETSPVITVNTPSNRRLGSVGRPLEGACVRLLTNGEHAAEGEILTKGPHVMQGYYRQDVLTREVIDGEGWLHTGDLGRVDHDGFLYITGRLKSLIVLGGGKKVHPEEVEAVLSKGATIKEVCVVGRLSRDGLKQGTEEVWAIVVPSDMLMQRHAGRMDVMRQAITEEFEQLGKDLAPYKRPSRIVVHEEELPKTATRKVKRSLVLQWLAEQEASL